MIDIIILYNRRTKEQLMNDWKKGRQTGNATIGKKKIMKTKPTQFKGSLHPFNIITKETL